MKQDILKKYKALRTRLEKERARLRARLAGIEAALGSEGPMLAVEPKALVRRKRKLSAANKAKLIAGVKARWTRWRAEKAGKAVPRLTRKAKKHFSAASRAALSAAAKRRWAKVKAAGKRRL